MPCVLTSQNTSLQVRTRVTRLYMSEHESNVFTGQNTRQTSLRIRTRALRIYRSEHVFTGQNTSLQVRTRVARLYMSKHESNVFTGHRSQHESGSNPTRASVQNQRRKRVSSNNVTVGVHRSPSFSLLTCNLGQWW